MSHSTRGFMCRRGGAVAAVLLMLGVATASALAAAPGRVDFQDANLPPATVEVDLGQEMFGNLFGIGDAAIAGIAEALAEAAEMHDGAEGTEMAAEQLAAAREADDISNLWNN